jgi:hypothetical protein
VPYSKRSSEWHDGCLLLGTVMCRSEPACRKGAANGIGLPGENVLEDASENPQLIAGWWARLPDGGMRRIWVAKHQQTYVCRLEICNAAQEAARERLFAAVSAAQAEGGEIDMENSADALLWSTASFAAFNTEDPNEALAFLGSDDIARCAMLAADAVGTAAAGSCESDSADAMEVAAIPPGDPA